MRTHSCTLGVWLSAVSTKNSFRKISSQVRGLCTLRYLHPQSKSSLLGWCQNCRICEIHLRFTLYIANKQNRALPIYGQCCNSSDTLSVFYDVFFPLTTTISQVHFCEDLTNDVLVFVWMYWLALYFGRYLSLFRMAGSQAGTPSLSLFRAMFSVFCLTGFPNCPALLNKFKLSLPMLVE